MKFDLTTRVTSLGLSKRTEDDLVRNRMTRFSNLLKADLETLEAGGWITSEAVIEIKALIEEFRNEPMENCIPVEVMQFSNKTIEALRMNRVKTVEDLQKARKSSLSLGWSIGVKVMEEIEQKLKEWPEFKIKNEKQLKIFKYEPNYIRYPKYNREKSRV